jgi:hypothetical protein
VQRPLPVVAERPAPKRHLAEPVEVLDHQVRPVDDLQPGIARRDEDRHQHVVPVVARVVRHREPGGHGREAERRAHVGRPEDQRLGAVGRVRDLVDVPQAGRRLDLQLQPDPPVEPGRLLDLPQQLADEHDLPRVLHLGNHEAVDELPGVLDDLDHVAVAPPGRDVVHPDDERLARPVALLDGLDDVAAGLLLGARRDGVLEVHEDLVGGQAWCLRQHLG